jgi:cardiolipin synthase
MYHDCEHAKKSIEMEQYILENDEMGQKFLKLFIKKAREGSRIKLVCDRFGSSSLLGAPLIEELKKEGGVFQFYQPLKWLNILMPNHWFPRTHVKTLLVDSKIIYVGGVCIAKRMEGWRDTHLRLVGAIAKEVEKAFDHRTKNKLPKQHKNKNFFYLCNRPYWKIHIIYKELILHIRQARKYIYISTAFFIPNQKFLLELQAAAERGVEVKIIVTKNSDILLADWVALSYLRKLVRKKVRVFHYNKTVFHCKTVIIDDEWATVGSTNMDILSFFYNREANIVIYDKLAITELNAHFTNDLKGAHELTKNNFHQIPHWKRILGFLARSLKIFFNKQ